MMMKQQSTYAWINNTQWIYEKRRCYCLISSIRVYSLSLEQTTNKFGNVSRKNVCRSLQMGMEEVVTSESWSALVRLLSHHYEI